MLINRALNSHENVFRCQISTDLRCQQRMPSVMLLAGDQALVQAPVPGSRHGQEHADRRLTGAGIDRIVSMRNNSRPIAIAMAFKTVIALELDPAHVIADLEEQREKNEKRRDFWRSFLSRAPMLIAALACTLVLSFSATYASAHEAGGVLNNGVKNYALSQ